MEKLSVPLELLSSCFRKAYFALLAYRTPPLQNGFSPSELLMCRSLRTTVPSTHAQRALSYLTQGCCKPERGSSEVGKRVKLIVIMVLVNFLHLCKEQLCGCYIVRRREL